MGANAQTSVPAFTTGQVLTAQQQTEINTGVPVFATTVTRDAAFGGTGEKVLAEGQLAYIEASNIVQYYDGSNWATLAPASAGALTLISATTIGNSVSSVTVSGAFSSTYENYRIIISGGVMASAGPIGLRLNTTGSGHYSGVVRVDQAGNVSGSGDNNAAEFVRAGFGSTDSLDMVADVIGPNLAKFTYLHSSSANAVTSGNILHVCNGFVNDTTQYTAFTIVSGGGNFTGGTIRVYGYANS